MEPLGNDIQPDRLFVFADRVNKANVKNVIDEGLSEDDS